MMHALQIVGVVVGIVVGIGGIASAVWAVARVRGLEVTMDLLKDANEALRAANADVRAELAASERECAAAIARLEGQNAALLDGVGDKVARAIADRLEGALTLVATKVVDEITQRREDRERRFTDTGGQTR